MRLSPRRPFTAVRTSPGCGPRRFGWRPRCPGRPANPLPITAMRVLPTGRAGYSLVQLIGAVVIGAILFGLVTPAVGHAVRVRLAEGVLKNDLQNAVNLYEQAYLADRRYPEERALQDQLSPGISLDSAAVRGERVYLRLRHLPTGQLCSVDYSRSSPVARNRSDCYRGGQARDTALTLTPHSPDAPGTDTFRIPPPTPPDTADHGLRMRSPEVTNPADQTGAPGETLSQVFAVTNRSPLPRTFRFETGSSNPDVVRTLSEPEPVTLLPGMPTDVRVTYTVDSGAMADAMSVIPLRAIDVADARWSATGSFSFTTGLSLVAPAVELAGPADRSVGAGTDFDLAWRVTNRSNAPRVLAVSIESDRRHVSVISIVPTGRVPFGAGETRIVTARMRVDPASDGGTRSSVIMRVHDAEAPSYASAARAGIATQTVLAAPLVTAPAAASGDPGGEVTLSWSVRNRSNTARSLHIAASVDDPSHLEMVSSSGVGTRTIARGAEVVVSVSYRVGKGSLAGRTSEARLNARDEAAPEFADVGTAPIATNLALRAPGVVGPGPQSAKPSEQFAVSWRVQNHSNSRRSLTVEPLAGGDITVVGSDGAGEVSLAAFEVRAVTVRYQVRDGSLAGASTEPTLRVADTQALALSAAATFRFTTEADVRAPTLSPPADRRMNPGEVGSAVFRLVNRSNVPATFNLAARSNNLSVVGAAVGQTQVYVEPYAAVDVAVQGAVPAAAIGNSAASVELAAVDASGVGATAAFGVSVNPVYLPPNLQWGGRRIIRPGASASDAAMVVNRSNVPVAMCFGIEVAAGSVAAGDVASLGPARPGCLELGPAGTPSAAADVAVAYVAVPQALAGRTNELVLTAYQQGVPSPATRADRTVEAELVLAAPEWHRLPASPLFWNAGEERALGYTLRNTANGERSFCVVITSGDTTRLAPVASDRVCGVRVSAYDTVRVVHSLRARGPGTALRVGAVAYDEQENSLRAEGEFYNAVRETRPSAVWDAPSPVYVRRWASFDATRSWSPVGTAIVRYVWTWGLFMQQWDPAQGRFVYTGKWEAATDDVSTPTLKRAYDVAGTYLVCLTVVDAAGRRSEPNCQSVSALRSTIARLAWRYRGWWTDQDFCLDVWWDNQCDAEHGNARWELDLRASEGDSPIKNAYALVRVNLHNTDDPNRPTTVSFASNAGTTPEWGSYSFGNDFPNAAGKPSAGLWRVLSTTGTSSRGWPAAPGLADHPLVLNVNLGKATGAFDTGPHWVPDGAWITLYVQDADGRWTSVTAYRNHDKGAWRAPYDTVVAAEGGPTAQVTVSPAGAGFIATGTAESPDGRIVDAWWEVYSVNTLTGEGPSWSSRGTTVELLPGLCERLTAWYVVKDDQGMTARASESVSGAEGKFCSF